jgi:osmoprotectant transport system substrate-binding protein
MAVRRLRLGSACLAFVVALALAACGGDDKPAKTVADSSPVRIGTKNFAESDIVGQLYKQALDAKGVPAELQSMVGTTEVINLALRDGSLDMYPEYIGVLLSEVDKIEKRPGTAAAAYRLAKQTEERRRFTLLEQTPFSDENALAVTRAFARREGVRSITDLARLGSKATLGAPPEFDNRFEGMIGLRERYGLRKLTMRPFDIGLQYAPLDAGKIDVARVSTTDSQLASGHYTLLSDPKGIFAKQHVAPLISRKALAAHGPQLARTLNAVSALLTTPVMRDLNAKAVKRSPAAVADEFLRANGLKLTP